MNMVSKKEKAILLGIVICIAVFITSLIIGILALLDFTIFKLDVVCESHHISLNAFGVGLVALLSNRALTKSITMHKVKM